MEVAVAALFVAAEDYDGIGAWGFFVKQVSCSCEMLGADAEISAEEGGGPGRLGWLGHVMLCVLFYKCRLRRQKSRFLRCAAE